MLAFHGQHAFALGTAMANWPTLPGPIAGAGFRASSSLVVYWVGGDGGRRLPDLALGPHGFDEQVIGAE